MRDSRFSTSRSTPSNRPYLLFALPMVSDPVATEQPLKQAHAEVPRSMRLEDSGVLAQNGVMCVVGTHGQSLSGQREPQSDVDGGALLMLECTE